LVCEEKFMEGGEEGYIWGGEVAVKVAVLLIPDTLSITPLHIHNTIYPNHSICLKEGAFATRCVCSAWQWRWSPMTEEMSEEVNKNANFILH
jgi:hypothetical protein